MAKHVLTEPPYGRWLLIGGAGVVGLLLIVLPQLSVEGIPFGEIAQHLGTALLIAAILGATIDFWFKHQLAKDVFQAAVGYLLPEELREEMRYIYANRLFCEQHIQRLELTPLTSETVLLSVATERVFINSESKQEKIHLTLSIDEWHEARPSRFVEYCYKLNDENEFVVDISTAKHEGHCIALRLPNEIILNRGDRLRLRYTYEEVKRRNGSHLTTFRMPTKNPRVEVKLCEGLECIVGFSNRPEAKRDAYPGVATLVGVLLPHQYIDVRWWESSSIVSSPPSLSDANQLA